MIELRYWWLSMIPRMNRDYILNMITMFLMGFAFAYLVIQR
jgi:hypothetical protein